MNAAPYAATVAASVRRNAVEQAMPMTPRVRAPTAVTMKAATTWRRRSPSQAPRAAGCRQSLPPASARCACGIGTPWRRSGSRAPWQRDSSHVLRGGFEECVLEAAVELAEARDTNRGGGQRLENRGRG